MATYPIPALLGQITLAETADHIKLNVTGVGDVDCDLSGFVGAYWPDALATQLDARLTAATGVAWTVAFSYLTGKFTFTCGSTFYFKLTDATIEKTLTGGDTHPDTALTMVTGERTFNHLGFVVDAAFPAAALTATSDVPIANCWFPTEPPARDSEYELEKVVRCLTTPNGYTYHADYSGLSKGIEKRTLRFEYQDDTSRLYAAYDWWKRYASSGGTIRFVPDRTTPTTYTDYVLAGESCQKFPFDQRLQGYGWFSGEFTLQKVW